MTEHEENTKDKKLWEMAEARVGFRKHLTTYIIVNVFLWILWYFTTAPYYSGFPWPAFVTIFWGVGIVSHYYRAFISSGVDEVQKEYDKLKNKQRD